MKFKSLLFLAVSIGAIPTSAAELDDAFLPKAVRDQMETVGFTPFCVERGPSGQTAGRASE